MRNPHLRNELEAFRRQLDHTYHAIEAIFEGDTAKMERVENTFNRALDENHGGVEYVASLDCRNDGANLVRYLGVQPWTPSELLQIEEAAPLFLKAALLAQMLHVHRVHSNLSDFLAA